MAQSTYEAPIVDIELSISPSSYSFASQQSPPVITLTLTSHAKSAITVATWGTPLEPRRALISNGFLITDQTTNELVPTSQIMVQRSALKRTRGTADENYYITLEHNDPVVVSTPFARGDGTIKPQPKAVVMRGWELDEDGNEMKSRRSINATGVDGLDPGHEYSVDINKELLERCRWAFATKDQVLVDHSGEGSYLQDYPWEEAKLDFRVSGTVLSVLD